MEKLSLILWRERELLETLLYRLEVEQLVLAQGRSRWLMRAANDVESILQQLRETEILRAMAADEAATSVGLSANPSLRVLAESVPEPWHEILIDHRDAFVSLTDQVIALAGVNRDLITTGYRAARETLLDLGGAPDSYGQDGAAVATAPATRRFDRSL
ncbi:flagellar protein FlgN [Nocardioides dongkuii]|uniref:flagellar protein FlgN n=1 Tax=Nocardioides dongkuii TaxID=2760089 RepID=UPI0015FD9C8B|nr:flagellar protein FlgN [Nocardioides dongkuii]